MWAECPDRRDARVPGVVPVPVRDHDPIVPEAELVLAELGPFLPAGVGVQLGLVVEPVAQTCLDPLRVGPADLDAVGQKGRQLRVAQALELDVAVQIGVGLAAVDDAEEQLVGEGIGQAQDALNTPTVEILELDASVERRIGAPCRIAMLCSNVV